MSEIVGIGVDMIEISRVLAAYSKESLRKRHFTEEEQQLIAHKEARAATTFAAKEAVVKAMGTGFTGISPIEINLLSIADTKEMAIAYATAISSGR